MHPLALCCMMKTDWVLAMHVTIFPGCIHSLEKWALMGLLIIETSDRVRQKFSNASLKLWSKIGYPSKRRSPSSKPNDEIMEDELGYIHCLTAVGKLVQSTVILR